ncbi:MAG: serine/threonine-protein kinase HipA [Solirubrobacterales bacterium]|nr:serine/threonine-protein kinase HipA [Solirubrobacterales bacterium]
MLFDGRRVGLTRGNPPSTYIVKAPIPGVVDSVANEAFCMRLAAAASLDAALAEPRSADGHEYLLVHRYDRDELAEPDGRLHQEDFCQALGLVPAVKYENEGGPNVADCARLIHRHSDAPARDIIAFLDALIFNFLIGNNDAHSKNYSLLLGGPGSIRLAPLYDLLSIAIIEGASRNLAMKYGGEKRVRSARPAPPPPGRRTRDPPDPGQTPGGGDARTCRHRFRRHASLPSRRLPGSSRPRSDR